MNYDQLDIALDKKMLDFNLKFFGFVASILLKPIAAATAPFYRKNLGERYFTEFSLTIGIVLWAAAGLLARSSGSYAITLLYNHGLPQLGESLYNHGFISWGSGIIMLSFGFLGAQNIRAVRARQVGGAVWHSMSRGESIFGREDRTRDAVYTLIAIAVLFLLAPALAGFFALSRILTYVLIVKEQRVIYSRFLDLQDAQIESSYREVALRDGPAPTQTGGIYGPLPGRFKGEPRANIARVVVGRGTRPEGSLPQAPGEVTPPVTRPPASAGSAGARVRNSNAAPPAAPSAQPQRAKASQSAARPLVNRQGVSPATVNPTPPVAAAPLSEPSAAIGALGSSLSRAESTPASHPRIVDSLGNGPEDVVDVGDASQTFQVVLEDKSTVSVTFQEALNQYYSTGILVEACNCRGQVLAMANGQPTVLRCQAILQAIQQCAAISMNRPPQTPLPMVPVFEGGLPFQDKGQEVQLVSPDRVITGFTVEQLLKMYRETAFLPTQVLGECSASQDGAIVTIKGNAIIDAIRFTVRQEVALARNLAAAIGAARTQTANGQP